MTYTACVNYPVLFYFNSLKICNLSVIKGDTQDYPEYLINLNALKQYWTTQFSWFRNKPRFINDFRKAEQPWVKFFWGVNIQLSLESNNTSKSVFDEKLGWDLGGMWLQLVYAPSFQEHIPHHRQLQEWQGDLWEFFFFSPVQPPWIDKLVSLHPSWKTLLRALLISSSSTG